jgi:hypothetical protein
MGGGDAAKGHHEEAGMFGAMEAWKRTVFGGWVLDKGLCAGLMRHVFATGDTIGDFGAGGGHYSTWFNETGLVFSRAFDGTPEIESITHGKVAFFNLTEAKEVAEVFDWVFSIEVAEHVPAEFEETLVSNWREHARKGLVVSWSDMTLGIGHVNVQPFERTIDFVQQVTGFHYDPETTQKVRTLTHKDYIQRTLAVFRAAEYMY